MLASLLRPKKRRRYPEHSPFPAWYASRDPLLPGEPRHNDNGFMTGNNAHQSGSDGDEDEDGDEHEHDDPESAPLLPFFAATHLGMPSRIDSLCANR
jgi:hypothetical protein